jgi:hypothetical protein
MFLEATREQQRAILGAMREIAAMRGDAQVTAADRASLAAVHHYLFRQNETLDITGLPRVRPAELSAILGDRELAAAAVRFMAVMALVDGHLDTDKIAAVLAYAAALGIDEDYLRELTAAAHGHLRWALMDMTRRNMESITGKPWLSEDVMGWMLPYRGGGADPALAARYRALAALPAGSFGRAYWDHYQVNGYALPGEENGLNEAFATPHDSTHVLSGYDTSPEGELMVSTFTAAMHRREPMAGHILPVIFSWHLGIKINDVARSATGALDPDKFWAAWARGAEITVDLFAPDWSFWARAEESLASLRQRYNVPPLTA